MFSNYQNFFVFILNALFFIYFSSVRLVQCIFYSLVNLFYILVYYFLSAIRIFFKLLSPIQFFYFVFFLFLSTLRLSFTLLSFFYNSLVFLFFFATSFFFTGFDYLSLSFLPLKDFFFFLKKQLFTFALRAPYCIYPFFSSYLRYFLSSFMFLFVFGCLFYNPSFFSSYVIENSVSDLADILSHSTVSHWYFSNWWYFRLWLFYIFLYLFFPSIRLSIAENSYFIFFFPMMLKLIDNCSDYFYFSESGSYSIGGGLTSTYMYFFLYDLLFPFFSQFGEGFRTDYPSEYQVFGFDGQELGEWYDEWDFVFDDIAPNYSFFDPANPETLFTYDIYGLFGLDTIYCSSIDSDLNADVMRRYLISPYGMDIGELTFKSNDLSDLLHKDSLYFDEDCYLRLIDSSDQNLITFSLTEQYFSFDYRRY